MQHGLLAQEQLAILFVCQHDLTGPSEKQMMGFAQQLAERGHRVLLSFGASGDPAAQGLRIPNGVELIDHGFARRGLRPSDLRTAASFAPTLIHAVNSRVPTIMAASSYYRATGAPVFVHFEDNEWRAWRGVPDESLYHRLGRFVRRVESTIHPWTWPHSTAATRRWVRRHALALDALTPELAAEVEIRLRRPCSTILPVLPEIDAPPSVHLTLPASLSGLQLAVVTGTIYPFSLEDTMQGMRAVAEVQRRGHHLGYVHAGNVHRRLDPTELAVAAGLAAGTFFFPGLLPYASMPELLGRATLLLQPGAPNEFNRLRLPSKLQSYLASGTPTITFATGFGELLADRVEALKIHTADPEELAERIAELLEDQQLYEVLSRGGARAAARLFNPARNTDILVGHYRDHLERRGAR